jgi:hypothetical protein
MQTPHVGAVTRVHGPATRPMTGGMGVGGAARGLRLRLPDVVAAGLTVIERVEQVGLADHAAVAHDHVARGGPEADSLHPLISRNTPLVTLAARQSSANGDASKTSGLSLLRVRRLDRVRLHAEKTILAKLACALSRARAVPIAA